jgi:hypothetical protein
MFIEMCIKCPRGPALNLEWGWLIGARNHGSWVVGRGGDSAQRPWRGLFSAIKQRGGWAIQTSHPSGVNGAWCYLVSTLQWCYVWL